MGILSAAPAIAAASCGVSCALLVPGAIGWVHEFGIRAAVRTRMKKAPMPSDSFSVAGRRGVKALAHSVLAICLESGVPSLRRVSKWLMARPMVAGEVGRVVTVLRSRGIQASEEGACQTLLAFGALLFLAVLLVSGSLLSALLAVVIGCSLVHVRVVREQVSLDNRIQELVPDAMRALGVYYGSGLTLVQSFEHAAVEVPAPLGPRLGEVAVSMKAGMSAADALACLRGGGDDVRTFAFASIALEIQHLTGAPMQPLLEGVAQSVSDSLRLKRSLEVQTAQARLSAKIVSIMPLVIVALMALVNPSYLTGFLSSTIGLAMFIVACALEVAGILAIRKILNVEVG